MWSLVELGAALLPSNHLALGPRWQGWFLRGQSGLLLITCFYMIVWCGPVGLWVLIHTVQLASYGEVMEVGHATTGVPGLRGWSWLLLIPANLYWADPALLPGPWAALAPALCFALYLALIVSFVLSIRRAAQCLPRYALLAWAHLAVLLLACPAGMGCLTLRRGPVWIIFAFSVITINDIMAYMFGFFWGRTPLIVLSPKKTVEGFVGGGLATLLLGPLLGVLLQASPSLMCPTRGLVPLACHPTDLALHPFLLHCLAISAFAATLGPVAGFLASGFKRAAGRKNFGSVIPGHGGVLDRCDCMFLMAAFTHVYVETFVY
jgi:phosphatidate cytidylyltransferase